MYLFSLSFCVSNCSNFTSNNATDDTSAVLAFRVNVTFQGSTNFNGNAGGCVSLVHSIMNAIGTLVFQDNTANEGGGIEIEEEGTVSE